MLEQFGPEIWMHDGPEVTAALGFHYPTRMAVIRLENGDVFVWSPTALSDSLRTQIDSLGTVRHLVAPNSLHHVFLKEWIDAFPAARAYAPPGLRAKRSDLTFHGDLGNQPPADWAGQIDQVEMRGNRITTEIVFFHRNSGTVLFTDLIQQLPRGWFTGWRALIARLDLMTQAEPTVPRKFRAAFSDRKAARAAVARILAWPAERVLMAHGEPVETEARAFLRRAFRWLVG